ncbi:RDD family protein [Streptosporangium nondiastaticum]
MTGAGGFGGGGAGGYLWGMSSRQPRWTQTWLGGVRSAGVDLGRPGERLGLPEHGSGSVAGFGRRLGALVIDWLICAWAITQGLLRIDPTQGSWIPLLVLAAEYILLVGTIGMTLGMRLLGIRVAALGGGRPPFLSVVVRTVLLCLAVPAMIWDRDQRGLHDRAAGTVVVRI